jgi:hypothetical protein
VITANGWLVLYRGGRLLPRQLEEYRELQRTGVPFALEQFTSVSSSAQIAYDFSRRGGVLFRFVLPDTCGKPICADSAYPSEEEIVLPPGYALRVARVERDAEIDRILIDLRPARRFSRRSGWDALEVAPVIDGTELAAAPAFEQRIPRFVPHPVRAVACRAMPDVTDSELAEITKGNLGELERRVFAQVNLESRLLGLGSFTWSDHLGSAARFHARVLSKRIGMGEIRISGGQTCSWTFSVRMSCTCLRRGAIP